jgi:hypothetical protein
MNLPWVQVVAFGRPDGGVSWTDPVSRCLDHNLLITHWEIFIALATAPTCCMATAHDLCLINDFNNIMWEFGASSKSSFRVALTFQFRGMQYLAQLFSSPELKAQVSFSDRPLSVCLSVWRLSVRLLYFRLLLQNRWANFNQSWHKSSLGKQNSEFYKWRTTPLPQGEIIAKE